MRVAGINVFAVIAAAVAFWLVGALWYGMAFSDAWMALNGYTMEQFEGSEWKMGLGPVVTLVTVVVMAIVFSWSPPTSWINGLVRGLILAIGFGATSIAYDYVYGLDPMALVMIDAGYLLVGYPIAGAILGVWR